MPAPRFREYWIVNLVDRQVEVYTHPTGPVSEAGLPAAPKIYTPTDAIPVVIDGREVGRIAVADILP